MVSFGFGKQIIIMLDMDVDPARLQSKSRNWKASMMKKNMIISDPIKKREVIEKVHRNCCT